MSEFRAFLRTVFHGWVGWMSGIGGLVLAVLAFMVPAAWQSTAFASFAVLFLFYACYRAWLHEHSLCSYLREQQVPRLQFERDPQVKPFYEEIPRANGIRLRCFRVALRNLGAIEVGNARLLLEACNPNDSPAVHLEHELPPMGKPAGTFGLNVPAYGTVVIDVAREVVPAGRDRGTIYLCYAQQGVTDQLPDRNDPYVLTLRAEGIGSAVRCSIALGGGLRWRLDELSLLPGA